MEGVRGLEPHANVDPHWLAEILVRLEVKIDTLAFMHGHKNQFDELVKEVLEERKEQHGE